MLQAVIQLLQSRRPPVDAVGPAAYRAARRPPSGHGAQRIQLVRDTGRRLNFAAAFQTGNAAGGHRRAAEDSPAGFPQPRRQGQQQPGFADAIVDGIVGVHGLVRRWGQLFVRGLGIGKSGPILTPSKEEQTAAVGSAGLILSV